MTAETLQKLEDDIHERQPVDPCCGCVLHVFAVDQQDTGQGIIHF